MTLFQGHFFYIREENIYKELAFTSFFYIIRLCKKSSLHIEADTIWGEGNVQ